MTAALPSVTLAASLLALAAQANGQDPAGKTPVDAKPPAPAAPATAEDFVERARTQLAAIGYVVPATIHSEQRTKAEALADLDAQQDLLMPADSFAAQFALLGAFRRPLPKDAAKLRKLTMVAMTQGLSAYYECRRKTFVMLDSTTRDVAEALAGSLLPLVAHELVHACQDARDGGIAGRFDPAHGTLDLAMARRCALEGEAEIASFLALQGPDAASRLTAMRAASKVEGLLAGELTGLIYAVGRELALARHAAGGLDAVRAVWQAPIGARSSPAAWNALPQSSCPAAFTNCAARSSWAIARPPSRRAARMQTAASGGFIGSRRRGRAGSGGRRPIAFPPRRFPR